MMKVNELPLKIQKIAKERIKTHLKINRITTYYLRKPLNEVFIYNITPEGTGIWEKVEKGEYFDFYRFHNMKPDNEVQDAIKKLNNLFKKI